MRRKKYNKIPLVFYTFLSQIDGWKNNIFRFHKKMRCKQQRTKTALPNLPRRKSATLRKYAEKSMRFYQKNKNSHLRNS